MIQRIKKYHRFHEHNSYNLRYQLLVDIFEVLYQFSSVSLADIKEKNCKLCVKSLVPPIVTTMGILETKFPPKVQTINFPQVFLLLGKLIETSVLGSMYLNTENNTSANKSYQAVIVILLRLINWFDVSWEKKLTEYLDELSLKEGYENDTFDEKMFRR